MNHAWRTIKLTAIWRLLHRGWRFVNRPSGTVLISPRSRVFDFHASKPFTMIRPSFDIQDHLT